MVETIADSAKEQSNGLDDINSTVTSLDDVTQQNSSMFEETNSATQQLVEEVSRLGEITVAFQTDEREAKAPNVRLAS